MGSAVEIRLNIGDQITHNTAEALYNAIDPTPAHERPTVGTVIQPSPRFGHNACIFQLGFDVVDEIPVFEWKQLLMHGTHGVAS